MKDVKIPCPMNHVAISVPDCEAAYEWYHEVFGLIKMVDPKVVTNDGSWFSGIVKDMYGEPWQAMKQAHMATADGIGVELFEFIDPKTYVPENTYEYWRTGCFHIAFTAPDIKAVYEKVAANGGKIKSKIWKLYPNKDYLAFYCQDPWGTIVEVCSYSYENTWANVEPFESY